MININKYIYIFLFASFISCGPNDSILSDKKLVMQKINIKIVTNHEIVENASVLLPKKIKAFLNPIECEENVYIPNVCVHRVDIKDSSFCLVVEKETANGIRDYFGTYDYENLKSDYEEYLPKIESGDYLSRKGDGTQRDFICSQEDAVFYFSKVVTKDSPTNTYKYETLDSVLLLIKDQICSGNIDVNKNIIIVFDGSNEKENPYKIIFNSTDFGQENTDKSKSTTTNVTGSKTTITETTIETQTTTTKTADCNNKRKTFNDIASKYGENPANDNFRINFLSKLSPNVSILVDGMPFEKSALVNLFHKNREIGYTLIPGKTEINTNCQITVVAFKIKS